MIGTTCLPTIIESQRQHYLIADHVALQQDSVGCERGLLAVRSVGLAHDHARAHGHLQIYISDYEHVR